MKRILGAALAAVLFLPTSLAAAVLTVSDTYDYGILMALSSAASGGDSFANDSSGRTVLVVTNGGAGSLTVTITPATSTVFVPGLGNVQKNSGGGTVSAGTTRIFGPFPSQTYNDTNGRVAVTYSTNTSVTVNPFRVPAP